MTDIPEIDIRNELLPRHISVIEALHGLSKQVSIEKWVLVGGLMVLVLGREHNGRSPRAEVTKDADVLVDIVANSAVLKFFMTVRIPIPTRYITKWVDE